MASEIYGVLTVGADDKVRRASRSGDGFGRAELSTDRDTLRLEVTDDGWTLFKINKRWHTADATPISKWEVVASGRWPRKVKADKERLIG